MNDCPSGESAKPASTDSGARSRRTSANARVVAHAGDALAPALDHALANASLDVYDTLDVLAMRIQVETTAATPEH